MRIFKILEKDLISLGDLFLEFPVKHQHLVTKGIEILRGLEEIKEEVKEDK